MGVTVEPVPVDGQLPRIALKSVASGKFVTAEEGGADDPQVAVLRGRADAPMLWETFALKCLGVDSEGHLMVALQTVQNGRWVCAEEGGGATVHANRRVQGPWEVFTVAGDLEAQFGLRTCDGRHFMTVEVGSTDPLVNATRTEHAAWQVFEALLVSGTLPRIHARGEEHGPIRVDGKVFRDENGNIWRWRGFTDFLLFYKFLTGVNIGAILDERIALGANVLRVFGMVGWDYVNPRFSPGNFPNYFDKLGEFIGMLADRKVRTEFVIFADAQGIMPDPEAQKQHAAAVMSQLAGGWNVFVETCNEPFKNGVDVSKVVPPAVGIPRASGRYDVDTSTDGTQSLFALDYGTTHPERKDEWPRTAKDLLELREGWPPTFRGVPKPWVADEPMGADETKQPGKRSNNPDDFAYFAACAALMGAGATFHSTDGIQSQLLRPVQRACAVAFFDAFQYFPADAQLWPYQRGAANGGPGIGNMPLEHFDAEGAHANDGALRTFCKGDGATEYCVAIRPAPGWTARARDGWRIDRQKGPRGSFVRLRK